MLIMYCDYLLNLSIKHYRRITEAARTSAELACFRAVAQETSKWEAREQRLLQQIDNLQQSQLGTRYSQSGTSATRRDWSSPSNQVSGFMTLSTQTTAFTTHTSPSLVRTMPFSICTSNLTPFVESSVPHSSNLTTLYTPPVTTQSDTQLNVPHTTNFTTLYTTPPVFSQPNRPLTEGTRLSPLASTFKPSNEIGQGLYLLGPPPVVGEKVPLTMLPQHSWHNKFHLCRNFLGMYQMERENVSLIGRNSELVAGACYWTDQSKLVNLVTRLRGQAYSYYQFCTSEQRSSYPLLVIKLLRIGSLL